MQKRQGCFLAFTFLPRLYFFSGTAGALVSAALDASAGFASSPGLGASAGLGASGAATAAGAVGAVGAAGAVAGAGAAAGGVGAGVSAFFPHAANAIANMAATRNVFFIAGFLKFKNRAFDSKATFQFYI